MLYQLKKNFQVINKVVIVHYLIMRFKIFSIIKMININLMDFIMIIVKIMNIQKLDKKIN